MLSLKYFKINFAENADIKKVADLNLPSKDHMCCGVDRIQSLGFENFKVVDGAFLPCIFQLSNQSNLSLHLLNYAEACN